MNEALRRMQQADWYYDDLKQVGVDFDDPVQVATYDARQKSTDTEASQLLTEIGVKRGWTLVDLGCGTGVLACQAALAGCHVHAVDISQAMLDATQARARHLGAGDIRVQRAGFLNFMLPDASVDITTTQYALHHLNDFWKFIALQRCDAAASHADGGVVDGVSCGERIDALLAIHDINFRHRHARRDGHLLNHVQQLSLVRIARGCVNGSAAHGFRHSTAAGGKLQGLKQTAATDHRQRAACREEKQLGIPQ